MIYGLRGQQVQFKPEHSQSPIIIQWLHDDNLVVEFNGIQETTSHSFNGRVALNWSTAQLQISDLRLEDSGTYRCQQYIEGKWFESVHELEVFGKDQVSFLIISVLFDHSTLKQQAVETIYSANKLLIHD